MLMDGLGAVRGEREMDVTLKSIFTEFGIQESSQAHLWNSLGLTCQWDFVHCGRCLMM